MKTIRLMTFVSATLLITACGESNPFGPGLTTPMLNADVAAAAADGVAEDALTMQGLNLGLKVGIHAWLSPSALPPQDCPFDSGTGWHACPEITTPNGLTHNRSYMFSDASGVAMESFDANLTAAIHFIKSLSGSIARETDGGSMTADISYARDMIVSGLQGDEQQRTWNGSGTSDIARTRVSDEHGTRSYELSADITFDDVVVPHFNNQDKDPWPLSGTITKVFTGTVTGPSGETHQVERTVVITFNGTQFPDATVNGEAFVIDLTNRRAMHRRP